MKERYSRLLKKQVYSSKTINSLETTSNLKSQDGEISVDNEFLFNNKPTVKVTYPVASGCTRIRLNFEGDDWRDYNRISFYIYPKKNGLDVSHASVELKNDGQMKYPRPNMIEGLHFITLKANQWNHVVWEIPEIPRDKITMFQFNFLAPGKQANMEETSIAYLSSLELQNVDADKFKGWETDGKIAFCHSGYRVDDVKCATVSNIIADEFSLLDYKTNKTVFTAKTIPVVTDIGNFLNLDFSDFKKAGTYILKCGESLSFPFKIENTHWLPVLDKIRNFFYEERCGCYINDIHLDCHTDCFCVHPDGRKISVAGGWHDAGDVSQGLCNTAESVTAFLDVIENLTDENLKIQLLKEAKYGLDWILKTRFGDGYRCQWFTIRSYTSGIVGDSDDLTAPATNRPFETLCAVVAEAKGYSAYKPEFPDYAEYCLKCAKQDYDFAIAQMEGPLDDVFGFEVSHAQFFGEACYASAVLYKVTKEEKYLNYAVSFARKVMECQQTEFTNWEKPFIGFFYKDKTHNDPLSYDHRGHDQAIVIGLALLMQLEPEHTDFLLWKQCLQLYKQYLLLISEFSKPYGLLPSAIYFENASLKVSASRDIKDFDAVYNEYIKELKSGIKLNKGVYLRRMPVVMRYRGSFGVQLSKAKAVSVVAKALNDTELLNIAKSQIEWVLGNNPFGRSFMYNEGYDYPDMFCDLCRNITGAIPVGMNSFEEEDIPFMPQMTTATFLEVWVHTASRMMWTISDLI